MCVKKKHSILFVGVFTIAFVFSFLSYAHASDEMYFEKGYTISENSSFSYSFTPPQSGYYMFTLSGRNDYEGASLTDSSGREYFVNWGSENNCQIVYLEEKISYKYEHIWLDFGDEYRYHVLKIFSYPSIYLATNTPAGYSVEGGENSKTNGMEIISFTPSQSGWYSFYNKGYTNPILHAINGKWFGGIFSNQGLHAYFEEGKTYYLTLQFLGNNKYYKGSISVNKAHFPIVSESNPLTIKVAGYSDNISESAFQYAIFEPSKSGKYKVTYNSDVTIFSCAIHNSLGEYISHENPYNSSHAGEYDFKQNETYYIGVGANNGNCTITIEQIETSDYGVVINQYLHTNIVAIIDGIAIRSYNIDGNTAIIAEDLINYGFNVVWNGEQRSLNISEGNKIVTSEFQDSEIPGVIGTPAGNVFQTDILTYVNGKQVTSYNIGGMTAIIIDDLSAFGNISWDGVTRTISFSR